MRFLMTSVAPVRHDETLFIEMGKFVEELTASGVLLSTGGMELGGATLVSKDGEITVTDGPYTEAKEIAGGYAIVEVRSREEAIELSRRFFGIIGDGDGRIQELYQF